MSSTMFKTLFFFVLFSFVLQCHSTPVQKPAQKLRGSLTSAAHKITPTHLTVSGISNSTRLSNGTWILSNISRTTTTRSNRSKTFSSTLLHNATTSANASSPITTRASISRTTKPASITNSRTNSTLTSRVSQSPSRTSLNSTRPISISSSTHTSSGPKNETSSQQSTTASSNSKTSVTLTSTSSTINGTITKVPGTGESTSHTSSTSSVTTSPSPISLSGTWTASSKVPPTTSFPFFVVPTKTMPQSEATSEAVLLAGLYFSLHANRLWITDPKLKIQYIDNIKKTKEETDSLFKVLDVKPPADPDCSNLKRKRSLISENQLRALISQRGLLSGLTDIVKDVANLLSCATKVVDNLVKTVEQIKPPISEIETLTDTLAWIGENLKNPEEPEKPSQSKKTSSDASSTSSSSSSSSSCTQSTAVPICTATVSLSTSFYSDQRTGYKIASITKTACVTSTIKGCSATGATSTTTVSSSTSASKFVCGPKCAACTAAAPQATSDPKTKRSNQPVKRGWLDPNPSGVKGGIDKYYMNQINDMPKKWQVPHRMIGTTSSAVSFAFDKLDLDEGNKKAAVTGLFGCTALIVISEKGMWFGHLWEDGAFMNDDPNTPLFAERVLDPIVTQEKEKAGKGNPERDAPQMPALFPLGAKGGILAMDTKPHIFISTPEERDSEDLLYPTQINRLVKLLTDQEGNYPSGPWNGIGVTIRGYKKPIPVDKDNDGTAQFALTAKSKALVEYTNDIWEDDLGPEDPTQPAANPQQAMWRVFLEENKFEEKWDARDEQKLSPDESCPINQKRADGKKCSRPSGSASASDIGNTPFSKSTSSGVTTTKSGFISITTSRITTSTSKTPLTSKPSPSPTSKPTSDGEPFCLHGASPHGEREPKSYCMCGPEKDLYYSVASGKSDPCPYTATGGPTITWSTPKAADPTPPPPPPKAYKTGICGIHIRESATGGDSGDSLSMEAEIKDDSGKSLVKHSNDQFSWGGTITIPKSDSKLNDDVKITFSKTSKSRLRKRIGLGDAGPIFIPNWSYESRLVEIEIGGTKWDTTVNDENKYPYFKVGGWDRNGSPPHRDMDAAWKC